MNKTLLLFKTLYRNSHVGAEKSDGKRKLTSSVRAILSILPLIVIVGAFMSYLASTLGDIKQLATFVNSIAFAVQVLLLFLCASNIITVLYEGKDTPFLQTLPIKSSGIFLAKFAIVYIDALSVSSVAFLPIVYAVTITFNIVRGSMFYGAYVLLLLDALLLPVLPLFLVTLFSLPIAYIGSFFKGKSEIKSVFTIIFYVLLMCAYLVLVYFMNTSGYGQTGEDAISQSTLSSLAVLSDVVYPDKVMIFFTYGIDAWKNFGITCAITFAMVAVSILLAMLFYKRINVKKSENFDKQSSGREATLKQNSVVISLAKKDFKTICRNSTLAMTCFANLIIAPLFIVLMYFITIFKVESGTDGEMSSVMSEMMGIGFVIMYSMIFLAGANILGAQAYTREGKAFFATKSLPIKPIESIKSKLLLATIVPAVIMIPIAIVSLALYKIDVVSTLFIVIDTMLMVVGINAFNILFDMKKGNQHWDNVSELRNASKGNFYQVVSAFMAVIPAVILFVLGMLLSSFAEEIGIVAMKAIYWAVATLFAIIVCLIGVLLLKKYGLKYYELIGQNVPKSRYKTYKIKRGLTK